MNSEDRRKRVVEMLDHWPDFFDQSYSTQASVSGEDGLGVTFVSSMSRYPSVVELVRCVELCRQLARGHYNHLIGYFGAEWRTVDRPTRRRDVNGKMVDELGRVRERVLPRWLAKAATEPTTKCTEPRCACGGQLSRMTCRAIDFVAGVWDQDVPLELPPALTRKLRSLADSDGWTEAA